MSDKEEQMTKNDRLRKMTESEEWGEVRAIFTEHIMDLQSINNIDPQESTEEQIRARRIALEYMMDFWKDVTGRVEQHAMNLYNELEEDHTKRQINGPERDYSNQSSFVQRN